VIPITVFAGPPLFYEFLVYTPEMWAGDDEYQKGWTMTRLWNYSVLLAGSLVILSPTRAGTPTHSDKSAASSPTTLRDSMRKLWADHVIWTRQYIVAATVNDPSADAASRRLLKNQEDIGQAIVPFYGAEAGTRLTALLKDHIMIAVDLVSAAKAGNKAKQTEADQRWHRNAEEIATFLSGANPNWPKPALVEMLNQHLALTTAEAVARLEKNWAADVEAFDKIFDQAMMMADALSDGIAKQFPTKV
jgi:hypothetical protein